MAYERNALRHNGRQEPQIVNARTRLLSVSTWGAALLVTASTAVLLAGGYAQAQAPAQAQAQVPMPQNIHSGPQPDQPQTIDAPNAPAPPEVAQPDQVPPPVAPDQQPMAEPQLPEPQPKQPIKPPTRPMRPAKRNGNALSQKAVPQPEPMQASDDPLPKNGGTPTDPATFDFGGETPLSEVINSIGRMTGKNFDIADPNIANQKVNIITHDKIPPEMAYQVLESVLAARELAIVEAIPGKLWRITAKGKDREKTPLVKGAAGVPKGNDTLSTHVVSVKYADATEMQTILKSLGSEAAVVDVYARTNTLIITDTADGLRRMTSFLEEVDIPGFDTQMKIFTLEYSRAETLASQIQEVLMGTGNTNQPVRPGQPVQPQRAVQPTRPGVTRPNIPGQQSVVVGSKDQTLQIVADERLNALIVVATGDLMDRVRDLVEKLDTPTPYEANNMNVFRLLNADCEEIEKALTAMLGSTPRQSTGGSSSPGGGGGGGGGAQAGELHPFEKKVQITSYKQNNSLLVLASPQDYKLIKEIIRQLDVPQRQVSVEAVIMDVSIQNTFGLSVDAAALTGNDGFAMGSTSNLNTVLAAATKLTDSTSTATNIALALSSLGTAGGMTTGLYSHINATVNGKEVKIPFVPLLLKALETLTDVDILSQPSLTTQDNKSADITSGQEIPVPTARSGYNTNSTTGTTTPTSAYGLSSYGPGITRQDVGVKMKVTPHINEGDYVSLETEIEVSETTPSNVGIDVNELGPTFNKSKVTNNVLVKDGTPGVIAGLIKETSQHNKTQTPVLGDMPVLGWMFRSKNATRKKQNIVVLITPFIIKEGSDLERVTDYKMKQFRDANVDALFEQGVIKKIKKRQEMRNKHRPSVEHSEEMLKEDSFSRGDIKR